MSSGISTGVVEVAVLVSAFAAVLSAFVSIANNWKITITHREVGKIHTETNSMREELVNTTRIAADAIGEARGRSEGIVEGRKIEKSSKPKDG